MPGIALEQARRGVQQEQRQEAVGFRKVKRPFQGPPGGSRVAERVPGHRLEQKRLSQPARPVHGSGAVQDRRERGGRRGRLVQGEPQRRRGNPHLPAFPVLFFQAGEGRTGWPDRGAFGDLARAEEQVTFDEAGARTPATLRTWVVLVDGAEHQLDLIRAEAAGRAATIHVVIDIIHVLEYLWKPAWSLHAAGDPAAEDWVAVKALAVLAGGSGRAAAAITAEAAAAGLTGSQRAGADTCVRYLSSKHELLRYDQALQAGCPIATGIIEGACRHLIADRPDIGGARWAWTALKPSSPSARPSATATSGNTGASTSPASTSGSTRHHARPVRTRRLTGLPHSRRAVPNADLGP